MFFFHPHPPPPPSGVKPAFMMNDEKKIGTKLIWGDNYSIMMFPSPPHPPTPARFHDDKKMVKEIVKVRKKMCRDHCSMMRSFPHLERFHGEKKIRKEILKEDMERLLWYNDHAPPPSPPFTWRSYTIRRK